MCGIVGAAGRLYLADEKVFKRLLELDTGRGPHSTGVAKVTAATGKVSVVKKLGTPWDLQDSKEYEELWKSSSRVLIGHNRWATRGKITARNAHPFEHDHIVGVHNGTLRNQALLKDHHRFEVDSDNLYYHMSKEGVDATVNKLDGAFTLVWYDSELEVLQMTRNNERPMFYAFKEDYTCVYWASEAWMLHVALSQQNVKYHDVQELPVGVLCSFPIDLNYNSKPFEKVHMRHLAQYVKPQVYSNAQYQANKSTTNTQLATKTQVFEKAANAGKESDGSLWKYNNQTVEFYVSGKGLSANNQAFVQCYLTSNDEVEVRVYATEGDANWEKLMGSTGYFEGQVRGYSMVGNSGYLIIDLRTLTEVIPDDTYTEADDDIPFDPQALPGYRGKQLSEQEFLNNTCKGCAWCTSPVLVEEAGDILWIAEKEFVCGDCLKTEEVKAFLSSANLAKAV